MDYSPFNALIWILFIGFAIATWLTVYLFQKKYPTYPRKDFAEGNMRAVAGDRPPES